MSIRPKVTFSARVAKQGNTIEECEDEFVVSPNLGSCALADGATDATYSGDWAKILVASFCRHVTEQINSNQINAWLEESISKWRDFEFNLQLRNLPWFTKEKLSNGSAATFVGLSFAIPSESSEHIIWKALAYGDACLFIVQDDFLRLSFPIESSKDFSNAPRLLRTNFIPGQDRYLVQSGSSSCGDKCYLMSDALACWFLKSFEENSKPWEELNGISNVEDFQNFVYQKCFQNAMRNDDAMLIIIEFEETLTNE